LILHVLYKNFPSSSIPLQSAKASKQSKKSD
jgi:hypothetical protein